MTHTNPVPVHADLLAAIDKARLNLDPESHDVTTFDWGIALAHNAHLDTLRDTLVLHYPVPDYTKPVICYGCLLDWPCPTAQIAIDVLTKMGALS